MDVMPRAAIRHGYEFDRVSLIRQAGGGTTEPDFTIVRMCSDADESHKAPQVRIVSRGAAANPVLNRCRACYTRFITGSNARVFNDLAGVLH